MLTDSQIFVVVAYLLQSNHNRICRMWLYSVHSCRYVLSCHRLILLLVEAHVSLPLPLPGPMSVVQESRFEVRRNLDGILVAQPESSGSHFLHSTGTSDSELCNKLVLNTENVLIACHAMDTRGPLSQVLEPDQIGACIKETMFKSAAP